MARTVFNMDFDWRFHLDTYESKLENSHEASYSYCKTGQAGGPASKSFTDTDWRLVTVPHDYTLEAGFDEHALGSHGYHIMENAWYRKSFTLEESLRGKQLLLCFDGVAMDAEFYLNGSLMARSYSCYPETVIDITDRAYFGKDAVNVLAVHVSGKNIEGWWYEGAGIYRHVRLFAKDSMHIAHNGLFAKPVLKKGTKNSWELHVETQLENSAFIDSGASVRAELYDGGICVGSKDTPFTPCPSLSSVPVSIRLPVSRPRRWDVDDPYLYTLRVSVLRDGTVADSETTRIGFRTIAVTAENGFFLNGKNIKLKGACNHQDHAGVGVAVPDSVQYYRVRRLKEMGCNAYRCAHNMPAREILDACDEYGILVMDENRHFDTSTEALSQMKDMVLRDRNHPSVAFYSLFNEEPLQNTEEGAIIYRRMKAELLKLDDSRLLTGAINGTMEGAGLEMDVTGINYNIHNIDALHAQHPDQPIMGSENNSAVTTRGCYQTDREKALVLNNYDEETMPWGQLIWQTWDYVAKTPWFGGLFIWTGFDYRGEPSPFTWPCASSQFGCMDTCGFAKEAYYFHLACFSDKPVLHLFPHWNWKKGEIVRVAVATNCEETELFLNGKSLGRKKTGATIRTEWLVPFSRGRITAKGYNHGRLAAKDERRTAGKPVSICVKADRDFIQNDGQDTVVLNCCVKDARGITVPEANNLLHFEVIGDGFIRGVGNGDPQSREMDNASERSLFHGLCQGLVTAQRGASALKVRVTGEGLVPCEVELEVRKGGNTPCIFSTEDTRIAGFTMSDITEERPDPLKILDDFDMNSFSPVSFDHRYQDGFLHGWRIYRAKPDIPAPGDYAIEIADVKGKRLEVYFDSEKLLETDKPDALLPQTASFHTEKIGKQELRILICADPTNFQNGIRGSVKLIRR